MELIRGIHNLRPRHRGCVATIGNFDGVHLGHQAVIGLLHEQAAALAVPATVIAFEPTPLEFFRGAEAPARLTRLREKHAALEKLAVDRFLCVRFDRELARLAPDEFVRRVLVDGLGVRYLVVGDDFRFGRDRAGDYDHLVAAGRRHGFAVTPTPSLQVDGVRASSGRIRELLQAGDLDGAARVLGRPYSLIGRVVRGARLGRTLGFPTANVRPGRNSLAVSGIFAVRVHCLPESPVEGVASIGTRPTVNGVGRLIEVHLFDFDRELYGAVIEVELVARLRDERRFSTVEALTEQMCLDAGAAADILARHRGLTRPACDPRTAAGERISE